MCCSFSPLFGHAFDVNFFFLIRTEQEFFYILEKLFRLYTLNQRNGNWFSLLGLLMFGMDGSKPFLCVLHVLESSSFRSNTVKVIFIFRKVSGDGYCRNFRCTLDFCLRGKKTFLFFIKLVQKLLIGCCWMNKTWLWARLKWVLGSFWLWWNFG